MENELTGWLTVRVTDDDILAGLKDNKGHCPVARATAHALEILGYRALCPRADRDRIWFRIGDTRYFLATPRTVAHRIDAWDPRNGGMKAFSFKLNLDTAITKPTKRLSYTRIGSPVTNKAPRNPGVLLRRIVR